MLAIASVLLSFLASLHWFLLQSTYHNKQIYDESNCLVDLRSIEFYSLVKVVNSEEK